MAKIKHPADFNQKAKSIVDLVTGEADKPKIPVTDLKAAAAALGRKGGLVGGKARAKALTAKRRSAIAKIAAKARWNK